jgi:hypothetical protein
MGYFRLNVDYGRIDIDGANTDKEQGPDEI